jgi:hypothetical protein
MSVDREKLWAEYRNIYKNLTLVGKPHKQFPNEKTIDKENMARLIQQFKHDVSVLYAHFEFESDPEFKRYLQEAAKWSNNLIQKAKEVGINL